MNDAHRRGRRKMRRQPRDQPLHFRDLLRLRGAVLFRPALDLPRDVIVAAAEVGKPERGGIKRMQPRQGRVHGVVDRGALGGLGRRHVRLPDDAAFDVIHEIERGSGNAGVVAVKHRRSDREALRVKRADHAELAVDGVRGRQQLARRLSPQHVTARRRLQEVRGVGLTPLELAHGEGRREVGEARSEKRFKPRGVDREPAGNLLGSGKRGLAVDRHGGVRGPICYVTFKLIGYALPMDLYHHDQVPFDSLGHQQGPAA